MVYHYHHLHSTIQRRPPRRPRPNCTILICRPDSRMSAIHATCASHQTLFLLYVIARCVLTVYTKYRVSSNSFVSRNSVLQCLLHTTSFAEHMRGQDLNRITNGLSDQAREDHPLVFFRFAAPIPISRMSNLIICVQCNHMSPFLQITMCSLNSIYPSSYYRRARRSLMTLLRLTRKTDMSSVDRRDMQAVKHALGQHNAVFLGTR